MKLNLTDKYIFQTFLSKQYISNINQNKLTLIKMKKSKRINENR